MESTLADTYWDIIGSIGFDLGWGRGEHFNDEEWDDNKFQTLKYQVKGGLQLFYKPPPDQSGVSHSWSFLRPLTTITLPSGSETVDLPFDYGGLEGNIYVVTDSGNPPSVLDVRGGVRARYAMFPDETGRPLYAEIEWTKSTTKERGQRARLAVFPLADEDFDLKFYMSIHGDMLNGEKPYAYGGADHSLTILAACRAYAEIHIDDVQNGPKWAFFMSRLATSISQDRLQRPQTLGYNDDRSDLLSIGYGRNPREFQTTFAPITYNGLPIE